MSKKTTDHEQKYFLYKNGKKREVTKEEYEKRYPPVEVESESSNDNNGVIEPNS